MGQSFADLKLVSTATANTDMNKKHTQ